MAVKFGQQFNPQRQQQQAMSGGLIMANGKPQQVQQAPMMQSMSGFHEGGQQGQQYNKTNVMNDSQQQTQNQGGQQQIQSVPATMRNVGQFQQWAQQRYGRQATQDELGQVARHVGYQGNGNDINEDQWNRAQQYADQMARQQGWNGPALQQPQPQDQTYQIQPVTGRMFGPQYQNPYQQQQQSIMNAILGDGGPMNQQVQDSMFEQQKEQANAMAKQFGLMNQQKAASSGFGYGNSQQRAGEQDMQNNLMQQLLGGRRDIATQAAQVNRADRYNALQQSMGLDQQGYQQQMGDRNAQLQEWLAQRQNQLENRRTSNQEEQFRRSLELEFQRFMESQRQFNQNFGENQRQFNNQLGFNYTNLNSNNNNAFMRYLMGY